MSSHAIRLESAKLVPEPCLSCPERRLAANCERDRAKHRSLELQLHSEHVRDIRLLREKDSAIHRQEVFGRESDHRLLNGLQMIVSLLSLQSRTETSIEAASHLSIAAHRIATIARIHWHLYSIDGRQTVAFKRFLNELCREYSTMLGTGEHLDRSIVVERTDVTLPTNVGIPLGLIANELVTNAIKHGCGLVQVKLEPQSAGSDALSVCNDGSVLSYGLDSAAGDGLGMNLLSALVEQIGGTLQIDRGENNEGARFTVLFSP